VGWLTQRSELGLIKFMGSVMLGNSSDRILLLSFTDFYLLIELNDLPAN